MRLFSVLSAFQRQMFSILRFFPFIVKIDKFLHDFFGFIFFIYGLTFQLAVV